FSELSLAKGVHEVDQDNLALDQVLEKADVLAVLGLQRDAREIFRPRVLLLVVLCRGSGGIGDSPAHQGEGKQERHPADESPPSPHGSPQPDLWRGVWLRLHRNGRTGTKSYRRRRTAASWNGPRGGRYGSESGICRGSPGSEERSVPPRWG